VPGQHLGQQADRGQGHGRADHGEGRRVQGLGAGPDHDQHAGKAQQDGGEAALAQALAEKESRTDGGKERCGEGDRGGIGHRH
jgi:hypothetical protein